MLRVGDKVLKQVGQTFMECTVRAIFQDGSGVLKAICQVGIREDFIVVPLRPDKPQLPLKSSKF